MTSSTKKDVFRQYLACEF